jgi:hypothetical protein
MAHINQVRYEIHRIEFIITTAVNKEVKKYARLLRTTLKTLIYIQVQDFKNNVSLFLIPKLN